MKNITYKTSGSFLGNKLINTSSKDMLLLLLRNTLVLLPEEITELKRINGLKGKSAPTRYSDYITRLYNYYLINKQSKLIPH